MRWGEAGLTGDRGSLSQWAECHFDFDALKAPVGDLRTGLPCGRGKGREGRRVIIDFASRYPLLPSAPPLQPPQDFSMFARWQSDTESRISDSDSVLHAGRN